MRLALVLLVGLAAVAAVAAPRGHARRSAAAPPRRGDERRHRADVRHDAYREPGQAQPRPLTAETNVPVNTIIDATNGRMGIESVNGAADFYGGKFVIREPQHQAVTQLWLAGPDPRDCTATTARVVRQVWGDGKGRFQTRGRYASATVRGTSWRVQDRCDGTLVTVARGVVAVRDFARGRTVLVSAGQSYLAAALAVGLVRGEPRLRDPLLRARQPGLDHDVAQLVAVELREAAGSASARPDSRRSAAS